MKFNVTRLALLSVLAAPLSSFALVGGAGPTLNSSDSPWSGVGSLNVNGSLFTATMIAPGYVLTAAHVVGADPSTISFQSYAGSGPSISASQVFVNPGYTASTSGNVSGDPTNHADLAIIKLSSAVANVPAYQLFTGNLQSKTLSFVSYAGSTTTMTTGENVADVLFADASGTKQTYLFDFDGPNGSTNKTGGGTLGASREASLVNGDSGSAAFVNVNGQWQLAGINTFEVYFAAGQTSGSYGTGGGGVILSSYSTWINNIILSPVPEPTTWLMLLAGLGIISAVSHRRKAIV